MDVRCENCGTEYEFDESQLRGAASKVKCTRCGHQFKVYRRMADAPEAVRRETGATGWMLRSPSGTVHAIKDVATLQTWILEGRVGRDFELSVDGQQWRLVGEVAELEGLFRQREELDRGSTGTSTPAPERARRRESVVTRSDVGSISVADAPSTFSGATGSVSMMARPLTAVDFELDDDELTLATRSLVQQTRKGRSTLLAVLFAAGAAGAIGVGVLRWRASRGPVAITSEGARGALAAFEVGSDEQLRLAHEQLERARQQSPDDALVLASLSEVATLNTFLRREDARALEARASASANAGDAAQARSDADARRLEAGVQLAEAKRDGFRALGLAPTAPDVARAWAYYLVADGAPVREVERFLTLARAGGDGADLDLVEAALHEREGDAAKAWWLVNRAVQRSSEQQGQPYPRALYNLARLALDAGRIDEARTSLNRLLALAPGHERAAQLLVRTGQAAGQPAAGAGPTVAAVGVGDAVARPAADAGSGSGGAVAAIGGVDGGDGGGAAAVAGGARDGTAARTAAPVVAPNPTRDAPRGRSGAGRSDTGVVDAPPPGGGDYGELVSQGDTLSEKGRTREAEKRYLRALALRPEGVEATVGLAYVQLDLGRTDIAISRFQKAVELSPRYGEAILGLAEAFRAKGNVARAIESYRRYLQVLPNGPKARMAAQNLRDLGASSEGGGSGIRPLPQAPGVSGTDAAGNGGGSGGAPSGAVPPTGAAGSPSAGEPTGPPVGTSGGNGASPNPPVVTGGGSGDTATPP